MVTRTTSSWVASFDAVTDLSGIGQGSRVWVPGPASGSMNVFARAHAAWAGATVVDDVADATHAVLTPSALDALLDRPVPAGLAVVVAGAPLGRALADRAEAAGIVVHHYYGAAELSFVAWGRDAASLRPFPGVEVDLRDGEVWVRSPYLAEGYADADGWATVGDRGAWEDGVLVLHGRPDAVTTGGATVLVAEVEAVLRAHAHGEVVVLGVPHPTLGEVLAAVLTDERDRDALTSAARDELVPAARPRRWEHVAALPLTSAGKVDRAALAQRLYG
jgi:acyl-CoA synthetase (AMP-forming)/AMP-acid ligase II